MSIHIDAKPGEIANTVLISGDPLRAKHAAEQLLSDVICYNEIRGMYGYTGLYEGKKVSIQGTGIGLPTTAIFVNEMFMYYGVKNVIRVGTCGSLQKDINIGEIILAITASTDSNMNRIYFDGMDYAPCADFELLVAAQSSAQRQGLKHHVGGIYSSDNFYDNEEHRWKKWIKHGILGVEMETSILYTLSARFNAKAMSILTVSDNIISGESSSHTEREKSYLDMMRIGFEIAPE